MIKWAGWLITFFGAAHTLGALVVLGAASQVGTWFSGALWTDDLAAMSPANSAFWLSFASFGVPLVVIGLTVLWLDRRDITPPVFLAWVLGIWTLGLAAVLLFTPWPILLTGTILLLVGIRRTETTSATRPAVAPSR